MVFKKVEMRNMIPKVNADEVCATLDNLMDQSIEAIEGRGLTKTQEIAVIGIIIVNTLEHAGLPKASRHVKVLLEELLDYNQNCFGGCYRDVNDNGEACHGK